jgi:AcrR family transcriptional regulator
MAAPLRIRRRPAEVRQLLVDAAARVFGRKGYAATTTDDIAREAGVAVSVMYRHFGSKAELFREAVLQPFAEFLRDFGSAWAEQRDQPWDEWRLMRAFIAALYDNLHAHRDALRGLISADGEVEAAAAKEISILFDRMFDEIRTIGESESELRGWFPTEGLELTIRLVVSMLTAATTFEEWLMPRSLGRDDLLDHATGLALYGLRREPPPGHPAPAEQGRRPRAGR